MKPKKLSKTKKLENYTFSLYSLEGFEFDETIEIDELTDSDKGLYYFSKRIKQDTEYKHKNLYLGKAEHLEDRPLHTSHEKWKKLKKDGCNCIGIYKCKKGEDPKAIESEILSKYKFKENIQENPKDDSQKS